MGHSIHGLYPVDFMKPKFAWHNVVLMSDSYSSPMLGGVQKQSIDRVSFEETEQAGLLVRVYAHHGRIDLRPDYTNPSLPKPKVSNYEVDFQLDGEAFKVTPETAASGKQPAHSSGTSVAGGKANVPMFRGARTAPFLSPLFDRV